ncbi:MAG: hypothetical protein DMF64_13410 [Acidobacteria bacterium]|nr:MAG: hypothetical protein DMF64_13410 [Acidobacteriota bacterium]
MIEDTSSEFDMFEDVRRKLTEIFLREGRELIEAERLALYIVQGVRDVPKFLTLLAETSTDERARVLPLLYLVLDNAAALEKARRLLLGIDPESTP